MHLDRTDICSMFVLMMHGQPLSVILPEDSGLSERFWYWRGASGQRYIHSIYRPDLCPQVPGAVFVVVKSVGGSRRAVSVGRLSDKGVPTAPSSRGGERGDEEIHVHLLARDDDGAERVLCDLMAAMSAPQPATELRPYSKPIQLELLAA